jgi:hypothetical protein
MSDNAGERLIGYVDNIFISCDVIISNETGSKGLSNAQPNLYVIIGKRNNRLKFSRHLNI